MAAAALAALAGCGSGDSNTPSEAQLHKELGSGPPSLAGMGKKHPGAANKRAASVTATGGGTAGTDTAVPPTTTTTG
jgi:hypothetical protein